MKAKSVFSLLLIIVTVATAQSTIPLEPLRLSANLTAAAEVYTLGEVIVIDFAPGERQPRNCTLEQLESPQGDILAFNTVSELKNGLTLRYDLSFSEEGSGGAEGFLDGLLFSNQQLYKVTGHVQSDWGTPKPEFCIEVFESLESLPGE